MSAYPQYRKAAMGLMGFTPYEVVESRLLGLGDAAKVSTGVASGAGVIAAAAGGAATILASASTGTALALIAAGTAAQALPVIGTIAGAVAIAAGFIAKAFSKAKAIKESRNAVEGQNLELSTLSAQLDNNIAETNLKRTAIYSALNSLGLNKEVGMNGLFANIFTPGKVENKKLATATDENARLSEEVTQKIATLESLKNDFQSLLDKLTNASTSKKNIQTAAIVGGSLLVIGGLAYLIFKKQ